MQSLELGEDVRALEAKLILIVEASIFLLSVLYFTYETRCFKSDQGFENESLTQGAVESDSEGVELRSREVSAKFRIISKLFPIAQVLCGILGCLNFAASLICGPNLQILLTVECLLWLCAMFILQFVSSYQKKISSLKYRFFLKSIALEVLYPFLGVHIFYKCQNLWAMSALGCGRMFKIIFTTIPTISIIMIVISSISSLFFRKLNICVHYTAKDLDKARDFTKRSLFSKASFSWVTPTIKKGVFKSITLDDFPGIHPSYKSENVSAKLSRKLETSYNLFLIITALTWKDLSIQTGLSVGSSILCTFSPYLLNRTLMQVTNVEPSSSAVLTTLFMSFALLATKLLDSVISAHMYYSGAKISVKVKLGLLDLVYKKVLLLRGGTSSTVGGHVTKSDVPISATMTNVLSTDLQNISNCSRYIFYLLYKPVSSILAIWLLLKIVGTASIYGLVTMALCLLVSTFIGALIPRVQKSLLKANDRRIATTNEVLNSIRGIKMNSKERYFIEVLKKLRKREIRKLALWYTVYGVLTTISFILVALNPIAVLYTHVFVMKKELSPPIAFTTLSLLASVGDPLVSFFEYLFTCVSAFVSLKRVNRFLNAHEIEPYVLNSHSDPVNEDDTIRQPDPPIPFVGFSSNATLSWEGRPAEMRQVTNGAHNEESEISPLLQNTDADAWHPEPLESRFILKNLNINFPKGKFTLVTGPTGSGKSSLLLSLLGEMHLISGAVHMPCRREIKHSQASGIDQRLKNIGAIDVTYFRQNSWLINSSIRNNIVFNSEWNPAKYESVLESCSLSRYLKNMADGDETVVGDRGMKLSGGQRLCVALARAAYSDSSVVLLDDPLSAMDPKLLKYTIEECFLKFFSGRTLIVAVNMIESCYNYADYIIVMDNGSVKLQGFRDEVLSAMTSDGGKTAPSLHEECSFEEAAHNIKLSNMLINDEWDPELTMKPEHDSSVPSTYYASDKQHALYPSNSEDTYTKDSSPKKVEEISKGMTDYEKELSRHGQILSSTYKSYIDSVGGVYYVVVLIGTFVLVHISDVGQMFVLKHWSNLRTISPSDSYASLDDMGYLELYLTISLTLVLFKILQLLHKAVCSIKASTNIHTKAIEGLLNTNVRFFDKISAGQVMNRLFLDLQNIDYNLMSTISNLIESVISVLAALAVITYSIPLMLLGLLPVYHAYNCTARTYLCSSIEIKRLEKITQSKLYSFFKQSLDGASEIRAFNAFSFFHKEVHKLLDANIKAYYYTWVVNRWLALRTSVINALVVFSVTIGISVLYSLGILDGGSAGLALSYSVVFSDSALWTIRHRVYLDVEMNSVERIEEYMKLKREPRVTNVAVEVPHDWPERGQVVVQKIYATYACEGENPLFVLKNLNININGGEKVAIMGQTGSGKSTFLALLLRLIDPYSGSILIDGIDISQIDLETLRGRITTVTQHPYLFAGTARKNVDPYDRYTDEEVENALEEVGLTGNYKKVFKGPDSCKSNSKDGGIDSNSLNRLSHTKWVSEITLNTWIEEGGSNLSQGQKQLMCIAAAIISKSHLIILDEVTSNTDSDTSEYINNLILRVFADSTIICVSHRIKIALEYDKIILIHKGEAAEIGDPWDLLSRESKGDSKASEGILRSICRECGKLEEYLEIAKKSRERSSRIPKI